MKKLSLSKVFVLLFALFLMFGISLNVKASSMTNQEKVDQEIENIYVVKKAIAPFLVPSVSVYGSTIYWVSSDPTVLSVDSQGGWVLVTRGETDKTVTLTVTIELEDAINEKDFTVVVPKGVTQTNSYQVNYELNGGENNAENPTTYKVGKTYQLLAPTKGVLAFLGWYDNPEFSGSAVSEISLGTSGDVTYYAKWEDPVVTGISIKTNPTKTTYNAKETFDKTGLVVEKIYNYGENEVLDLSSATFDKTTLHAGDTKVVVTFNEFSAEIDIVVNKLDYDLSGISFTDESKVYNGAPQTIAYTGTLPLGLNATVSGSCQDVTTSPVLITLNFENTDEDYNTPSALSANLTITKAKLTVKADDKTMKVASALPSFTYTATGFVGTDTEAVLNVTDISYVTQATTTSPAGDYDIVVSGITAQNYEIDFVKGTLTISTGDYEIRAQNASTTYTSQNQMFTAKLYDGDTLIEGIEFTYTKDGATFTGAVDSGVYQVLVSYDDAVYGTGSKTISFEIAKKALETSMFDGIAEQAYTGAAIEVEVLGIFGDDLLEENVHFTTEYANNIEKGQATVTLNAVSTSNYTGSAILTFTIGDSELEKVAAAKSAILSKYSTVLTGSVTSVEALDVTSNGATVEWMSSTTAFSVNPTTGVVTIIQAAAVQTVELYAYITCGDAVDYVEFNFSVPAKQDTVNVNLDLVQNFATYASEWNTTYAARTVTMAAITGDVNSAVEGTVDFTKVNKPASNTAINDRPVFEGNGSTATVKITGHTIESVSFTLKEWNNNKKFTAIQIEYRTSAEGEWITVEGVGYNGIGAGSTGGNVSKALSAMTTELPDGVISSGQLEGAVEVRLVITASGKQQLGLSNIAIVAKPIA